MARKILKHFIAPYDATAVERLRDADAVFIGKTNMDEFAMGSSCEKLLFRSHLKPPRPRASAGRLQWRFGRGRSR